MKYANQKVIRLLTVIFLITISAIQFYNFYKNVLTNNFIINDDNLQHTIVYNIYKNPELLNTSYSIKYYLDMSPIGYKYIFSISKLLNIEIIVFSKIIAISLYIITLIITFFLGKNFDKDIGGIIMVSLYSISLTFIDKIAGGLPRAFAYPLVALFLLGIFSQNLKITCCSFIASALFYPPLLLNFSIVLLINVMLTYKLNGFKKQDFFILSITIISSLCFLTPTILKSYYYGGYFAPNEYGILPELNPNCGRISIKADTYQSIPFVDLLLVELMNIFHIQNPYIIYFLSTISIIGLIISYKKLQIKLIMLIFTSTTLAFYISQFFYPKFYIPSRNLTFFLPFLFFSTIINFIIEFAKKVKLYLVYFFIILGLTLIATPYYGYNYDFREYKDLFNEIKKTPKSAIIAGLPDPILDGVQLFGERAILVGYETFAPFHKNYLLSQRRKMIDNIELLFTENKDDFNKLIKKYKITHILIPKNFPDRLETYQLFCPYTEKIKHYAQIRKPFLNQIKEFKIINNYKLIYLNQL